MGFNQGFNNPQARYTQTLLGGSQERYEKSILDIITLMAAFSYNNGIFTSKTKKPPLKPPLTSHYQKCIFYNCIYSDLKGFLNIIIIFGYISIWISKCGLMRLRSIQILTKYQITSMLSCFYAKILKICQKNPWESKFCFESNITLQ